MFTTRPELRGTYGMVASTHWLASTVGMSVLERGGNAFDAAVAAGFTLQVVEPHLNGPAGEVPLIFAPAGGGATVLCGQGPVPAAADVGTFRAMGLDRVPGTGLLAACVPGAFDAWMLLLRDHGTMRLRDVLDYAIGYAQRGFPAVPRIAETVAAMRDVFTDVWPTSGAVWLVDGGPRPGRLFRNPALAATYARIVDEAERAGTGREAQVEAARRIWREGFVADSIMRFGAKPVGDLAGGESACLLTADDLAAYEATYEPPVTIDHAGLTVCKTGPWGQGPVFGVQLRMLEVLGVDTLDLDSADFVHTAVEVAKLAFADREAYFGDPRAVDVPLAALMSKQYAHERAALVGDAASYDLRPGSPGGRDPYLTPLADSDAPTGLDERALGDPTVARSGAVRGDTCHVDVVDRWGNMVAATPSGGWLSSSPAIPDLGFPLGTRAQMCWLDEGSPSALVPGRRPRTTLSPTLVLRDGEPVLAFGTPGGDQQDQWQLTFFLRHVHGGLDLQASIDAPMFHSNAFPSSFYPRVTEPGEVVIEERLGAPASAALQGRGHRVSVSDPWSLGRLSAVARDPESGVLAAAANPRGMQGYAAGR